MNQCLQAILHQHLPKKLLFASKLRQCSKPVRDVICKIALEHGQQTLSDSRSPATHVEIARVLAPRLVDFPEVLAQSGASFAKKRSDGGVSLRMNTGEPSRTCPAEQVREHCFRLIVLRVCDSDAVGFSLRNQPLKKGVSQPPAGIFQVPLVF